jgi:hypothetical protein
VIQTSLAAVFIYGERQFVHTGQKAVWASKDDMVQTDILSLLPRFESKQPSPKLVQNYSFLGYLTTMIQLAGSVATTGIGKMRGNSKGIFQCRLEYRKPRETSVITAKNLAEIQSGYLEQRSTEYYHYTAVLERDKFPERACNMEIRVFRFFTKKDS